MYTEKYIFYFDADLRLPRFYPDFSFVKKICARTRTHTHIHTRTHNTGRSFEPIFLKFTWLAWVHPWVNPIVFGKNRPNRTTDWKKMLPQKPVFWVSVRRYEVFQRKNLKIIFDIKFPRQKIIKKYSASHFS